MTRSKEKVFIQEKAILNAIAGQLLKILGKKINLKTLLFAIPIMTLISESLI